MKLRSSLWLLLAGLAGCVNLEVPLRGCDLLLSVEELDGDWLSQAGVEHAAVVLRLTGDSALDLAAAKKAVSFEGHELDYWIEIARCPELADAHPEWMASLQGHGEWRRLFPAAATPGPDEVVKNYPWVPIAYAEAFEAQLARVTRVLAGLPKPRRIYLNDLQGAPSACGCGNDACRWTSDYGPRISATKLGPDAAARFVQAVGKLAPDSQIVPVWMTECQQADAACAGVACYGGKCWEAWTEQLMPLERVAPLIAVLEQPDTHSPGAVRDDRDQGCACFLRSFSEEPARHGGRPISASRLISVCRCFIMPTEGSAKRGSDFEHEWGRLLIAASPIDQSWQPRLVPWKAAAAQN